MASAIVFLAYACGLLPLLAAWKDDACVFPFIYGNGTYSSCTSKGSQSGQLWCATTPNFNDDHHWKYCTTKEYGGNSKGKPCKFPFIYIKKTYYTCTIKNSHKPWCATTDNYDWDKEWSYCADTTYYNACVFPFSYGNKIYSSCTSEGTENGQLWCATTPNYNDDQRWKWCTTKEYGGNSNGEPCQFPFTYMSWTYYTCTTKNSHIPWCATTGNYDWDKEWSYCADTRQSDGPCVFPFKYKNTYHTTCITEGSPEGKPWCSQTKNYDEDPKRVFCEASEANCIFPFIYKAKRYCSCTKDGTINGPQWCATTSNYDRDRKWRTCISQEFGGNSNGETCVIPFTYKEKTYDDCTNVDEPSGKLWCATTPSYDKDAKWTFCADAVAPEAEPCIFPFNYKNTTYASCTKDGSKWNRPWCSLTSDFDVDHRWKYCSYSDRERGCQES